MLNKEKHTAHFLLILWTSPSVTQKEVFANLTLLGKEQKPGVWGEERLPFPHASPYLPAERWGRPRRPQEEPGVREEKNILFFTEIFTGGGAVSACNPGVSQVEEAASSILSSI